MNVKKILQDIWGGLKKYWMFILAAVTGIGGYLFGRSRGNAEAQKYIEQLRRSHDELAERLSESQRELQEARNHLSTSNGRIGELESHQRESEEHIKELERRIAEGSNLIADSKQFLDSGECDIGRLQKANDDLRSWLSQYGEKAEEIPSVE